MKLLWPNGTGTMPTIAPGDDSEFGMRWHPIRKEWAMHYGLDCIGFSTLRSPVDGEVVGAEWSGGWGNLVRIRAWNGDEFWMAHCASMLVARGVFVTAGQAVAVMGTTGNSTGVHLHYEVRPGGGSPVSPRDYYARTSGVAATAAATTLDPLEDDMPDSMYAEVDGVQSWCWLNWGTGELYAVHTQADADWVGAYMGSVRNNWAGDPLGGEKYKSKLALFNILCPDVKVHGSSLTQDDLDRIYAMLASGRAVVPSATGS